jgi:TetR/AcrR family transcriptional regulator, transcriptional repressor for nem operon
MAGDGLLRINDDHHIKVNEPSGDKAMRVSREQAAKNRERIVAVASRLFREKGFDGVGVADLMKDAGFTHGGFYGHFSSKDELIGEASERILAASARKWAGLVEQSPGNPLQAIVASYLRPGHRDNPRDGCALPTLATEVARQDAPQRSGFTRGVGALLDILVAVIPGRTARLRRQRALATLSGLVGAVVLARAVNDSALSDEILSAALSGFGQPPVVA